jgi:hypothetical protein
VVVFRQDEFSHTVQEDRTGEKHDRLDFFWQSDGNAQIFFCENIRCIRISNPRVDSIQMEQDLSSSAVSIGHEPFQIERDSRFARNDSYTHLSSRTTLEILSN